MFFCFAFLCSCNNGNLIHNLIAILFYVFTVAEHQERYFDVIKLTILYVTVFDLQYILYLDRRRKRQEKVSLYRVRVAFMWGVWVGGWVGCCQQLKKPSFPLCVAPPGWITFLHRIHSSSGINCSSTVSTSCRYNPYVGSVYAIKNPNCIFLLICRSLWREATAWTRDSRAEDVYKCLKWRTDRVSSTANPNC